MAVTHDKRGAGRSYCSLLICGSRAVRLVLQRVRCVTRSARTPTISSFSCRLRKSNEQAARFGRDANCLALVSLLLTVERTTTYTLDD